MKLIRYKPLRLAAVGVSISIGVASALSLQPAADGDDYQPGTPFTYLFDAGGSSPRPLTPQAVAAKTGWTVLPEDDVTHEFRGDAVLLNDKLAVVLRAKGPGAEVYSQTPEGIQYRLVLTALPNRGRSLRGWSALKILENNPGAVMLQATFRTARGPSLSVTWRLTTGQQMLEVHPGKGAERLVVWGRSRYVVVPDFFGDDMVFGTAAFGHPRLGLPTENFCLNLLEGGDAMAMCVWKSSRQEATAILLHDGRRPMIAGSEIQCLQGQPIWVALMEAASIWHERPFSAADASRQIALDWRPPFAARWRADFVRPDGVARSWNFADAGPPGCPCWFDADRAMVRVSAAGEPAPPDVRTPKPVLVYPIDRSRATPLTAFCPTDVLRNTLGVGPCQYVLQTEGLASDTNPTPDQAMDWIEKQFEKQKEKPAAEQIEELLGQMIEHVRRTQQKIDRYAAFAQQMRTHLAARQQDPEVSAAVAPLSRIVGDMERTVAMGQGTMDPAKRAAELADAIVGLIGKGDGLAGRQRLGMEVRGIGAVEDRTLSKCRMTVRWLRQQAKTIAANDPPGATLAKEVQIRAEKILRNK